MPAFYYGLDRTGTTECLFIADEPGVAYIDPVDCLGIIFTSDFIQSKNPDGTFTVTKSTGETMIVDVAAETIFFDSFENFVMDNIEKGGSAIDSDYVIEHPYTISG